MNPLAVNRSILDNALALNDGAKFTRVRLADLRIACWRVARADLDAALVRLAGAGIVALFPEDDRGAITGEDASAALVLCGVPQHYMYVC